jgi:PII-like signaling protein
MVQSCNRFSALEVTTMMLPEEGYLLRIFIGESDRHDGKLLHEWIVMKAKEDGLAGATVLRGMMGFGAHSRLHTFKIERLSQDLPIVIEIVDTREKLENFLSLIDNEIEEGMATLERVQIHFYRSGKMGQYPDR